MRRALLVALLAAALLLVPGAAAADDEYEIDERLARAGLPDALTDYLSVDTADGEGLRVVVDFDSGSTGRPEYEEEVRLAAELVWEHLEYRVVTVVVAPTEGVSWRDGAPPPAVALSRSDLQETLGPRPEALDAEGAGFFGSEGDLVFGIGALVVALLVLGAGVLGGFFLGRWSARRTARHEPWQGAPWDYRAPQGVGPQPWAPGPGAPTGPPRPPSDPWSPT